MHPIISQIGYRIITTKFGQLIFRKNPLGRAIVRWAGSLAKMLPLDTPQYVMIDICNVCNFKCKFCPTSDRELLKKVGRPKGIMDLSLFKKIIDDLKSFNRKITVLTFHKDGEPLLNKQVVEMVKYAKEAGVADTVEITTNASLLFPDLADKLIEAGLDCIRISVEHVSSDGYKNLVQSYSDYDQIITNVRYLYNTRNRQRTNLKILTKIINTGLSEAEIKKFYDDWSPISDLARVEGIMGWSNSNMKDFTLGLKPQIGMDGITPIKPDRIVCPEPFKMMAINFNGAISPCCDDWSHDLIVGDANTEKITDVWIGENLNHLRCQHLDNRKHELRSCANCQYMLGVTDLFDLDKKRLSLLQYYQ